MVHGDGAHVDELCQVVLVGDVVAVPRNDIKRGVVLRALEELSAELIDDFPGGLFNFVLCDGVEEVAGVGEAVGSEGAFARSVRGTADDTTR